MPLRLLLLVTDLERGGTPTVVRELAARLATSYLSLHVEVACLAGRGPVVEEIEVAGVEVTPLHARGRGDRGVITRFITLVRDHRIDTVLSFLVHANVVAAAAAVVLRDIRWLQSIQTTQPWPAWHWVAQRAAALAAESIVVPSASVAAAAHHQSGIPLDKLVVIPNAINMSDFDDIKPASADTRPFPVTFLGRLDPVKDVPTLIDAVARLRGEVRLDVFGEGSDRGRIERAVADHHAAGLITLHGSVARPADALQRSGMLVLPSLAEGFGLVLIEAMAAGIPVIATDVAGIRDVVRPNVTGLLVPAGDAGALAGAMQRMTHDPSLRETLVTAARLDVAHRFTWAIVLQQYASWLRID